MPQNGIELSPSDAAELLLHLPTSCLPGPQDPPRLLRETVFRNGKWANFCSSGAENLPLFLLKPFVAHKNLLLSFNTDILMDMFFLRVLNVIQLYVTSSSSLIGGERFYSSPFYK